MIKKKRYKLRIQDPIIRKEVEREVIRNAEKYLRFKENAKGELKPLLLKYYLEVEEYNGEKFEMPYADICFVELGEDREPALFYKLKIYFPLRGEFIYVSKSEKSKESICQKNEDKM